MARTTRALGGSRLALAGVAATAVLAGLAGIAVAGPPPQTPTDLSIVKTNVDQGNAAVQIGDTVTYQIAVSTLGPQSVESEAITVTDEGVALVYTSGDTNADGLLDPGETWLYGTANGPVTKTVETCSVSNTATVTLSQTEKHKKKYGTDPNPANDTSTVVTDVICDIDLTIDKASDSQTYVPGGTATYTIVVGNNGPAPVPVSQIQVSDPNVTNLTLTSPNPAPAVLAPGQTLTYTGTRAVGAECGPLVNTATVGLIGGPLTDTNPSNNTDTTTSTVVCTTDVAISKTSDKDTYAPGETVTYTVRVTNTGQSTIPFGQIQVSDPGATLTLVGAAPASLAPGGVLTYTATRTVAAANCGPLPNTATVALVNGAPAETTTTNNTATRTVTVAGEACTPTPPTDVSLAKSADKAVYAPGQTITYTVAVTNTGQSTIPFGQIQVSDPGATLTLVGAAPASLAPGGVLTYTATRTVSIKDCGPVVNTATVSLNGAPAETSTANNTASVTITVAGKACKVTTTSVPPPPVIRLSKTGPGRVEAGQEGVYTIVVRNSSNRRATGVVVTDRLPGGLSLSRGLPRGARLNAGAITWRIGTLAPRSSRTVRVRVRFDPTAAGRRCNTATVSATNRRFRAVSARQCTVIRRIAGVEVPPVTG